MKSEGFRQFKGKTRTEQRDARIEWLISRVDLFQQLAGALGRNCLGEDDLLYVVNELKDAGLLSGSTYWKDFRLDQLIIQAKRVVAARSADVKGAM